MKKIIFKKEATLKGKYYSIGKELKDIKDLTIDEIIRLNERGFIESLNREDIQEIDEYLKNPLKNEDKEDKNEFRKDI